MSTGPLIRDFVKEERDLRFSDSGSIAFTEIEKNAYRLSLTLEITDIDGERYQNRKTLPDNTHLGYVTLFRGSSVTELIAVKFVRQRIFDIINQGIWNYHQATETISLIDRIVSEYGLYYHVAHLTLAENTGAIVPLPKGKGLFQLPDQNTSGEQEAWRIQVEDIVDDAIEDSNYRGFPIASPFPDIAKFRADLAASFLFRLETWYLKNPLVYLVDNPTDTGDETEGEDEFPEPNPGDGDGDGDEFPTPDPMPPDSDPRDFSEPRPQSPPDSDFGDTQPCGIYTFTLKYGWTSASGATQEREVSGAILGRVSKPFLTGATGGQFTVNAQSDPAGSVATLDTTCGPVSPRILVNPGVVTTRSNFVIISFSLVPFSEV